VITCDTAIAHLAGALGKPVWILLGQPSDWRWGLASAKTPWYRSATLIRSKIAQDWSWPVNYATAMLHGFRRVWGEFSPPSTGPARE
jgi:ADP-heptose:LPS heptosyltransferase